MSLAADGPVLFFDGVCNLCSGLVQFIIKHERKKRFLFAALQSEAGKKAIAQIQGDRGISPDSLILFYKGKYYTKSAAALLTAKLMGAAWSLFYIAIIIPPFIRNGVYELVAGRRYKWFGKQKECMIPSPDTKDRFLG